MSAFFTYRQNNSGGSFRGPAVYVHVEADSVDEANRLVSGHISLCGDSGMYAEYDSCGCCPCCGHRWSPLWDDKPTPKGAVKDHIWLSSENNLSCMGAVRHALVKSDGSLIVGNSQSAYDEIANYIGLVVETSK